MAEVSYALSLKQPWATLLVHGLKTVEVRRWPTARVGPILIHAARVPVEDGFAWQQLPDELRAAAQQVGGIVGRGELTECVAYSDAAAFAADRGRHLNNPGWFQPPVMYGFVFAGMAAVPFRPYPGWMRFFPVRPELPVRKV